MPLRTLMPEHASHRDFQDHIGMADEQEGAPQLSSGARSATSLDGTRNSECHPGRQRESQRGECQFPGPLQYEAPGVGEAGRLPRDPCPHSEEERGQLMRFIRRTTQHLYQQVVNIREEQGLQARGSSQNIPRMGDARRRQERLPLEGPVDVCDVGEELQAAAGPRGTGCQGHLQGPVCPRPQREQAQLVNSTRDTQDLGGRVGAGSFSTSTKKGYAASEGTARPKPKGTACWLEERQRRPRSEAGSLTSMGQDLSQEVADEFQAVRGGHRRPRPESRRPADEVRQAERGRNRPEL